MSVEQIKIISGGNGYNTQIISVDGFSIKGVSKIDISVSSGGLATAVLTFENAILDIEAQADLSQIAKQDGSE